MFRLIKTELDCTYTRTHTKKLEYVVIYKTKILKVCFHAFSN